MPDSNGIPVTQDVLNLITLSGIDPTSITDSQNAMISTLLSAVIADFQAPVGRMGKTGGTGRQFIPSTETRTFDGTGEPVLEVPDLIPPTSVTNDDGSITVTNPITVNLIPTVPYVGLISIPVTVESSYRGTGFTRLVRQFNTTSSDDPMPVEYWGIGGFPEGFANIQITATWGLAGMPLDVSNAVAGEAAARWLIATQGTPSGIGGNRAKTETTEVEIGGGSQALNILTSSIITMRQTYKDCIQTYRDRGLWKLKQLVPRMN